ncbi:unnamed protein product, partial [Ectocarpus sp. 12 AP-2014]
NRLRALRRCDDGVTRTRVVALLLLLLLLLFVSRCERQATFAMLLRPIFVDMRAVAELGGQTLRRFSAGQLIIHTPARPISRTQSMELSSLARLT